MQNGHLRDADKHAASAKKGNKKSNLTSTGKLDFVISLCAEINMESIQSVRRVPFSFRLYVRRF